MSKGIDRISSLPDDALTCILSFLTTREAMETCFLSKRWRNTWASVPILNFDFDEFPGDLDDVESWKEKELKFGRFVRGVLENRGPSHVDTFIIRGEFDNQFMDPFMGLLDRAALLMPRVICADIPEGRLLYQKELNLPDSVFSCSRLENLELHQPARGFLGIEQNSIALSSLKTLKLSRLALGDDFFQKLLLGCPALETLKFFDCNLSVSDISSNSLRKLNLYNCWCVSEHMRISCPVLVSLIIRSEENINRNISFENMASLVNACIKILEFEQYDYIDFDSLPNSKFLSGLSNATSLMLDVTCFDSFYKEHWLKDISNFRTFYNLKNLELGTWNMANEFSLVACFLRHSPVLEHLTLWLNNDCGAPELDMSKKDLSFDLEYLETVNIFCKKKKLAYKLLCVLGRHVGTIGNINIRKQ